MTVLFIGYDLFHKGGGAYDKLEDAIKDLGSWWHCLDSTWFVDAPQSDVAAVRDQLTAHLGRGDTLLVVKVETPTSWASQNLDAGCNDWLRQHVSR